MQYITAVFDFIVNGLGSTLFLPLIMIVVGKIFKMKWKDAISCGIMLAVAFASVSLVMGLMFDTIGPAGKAMAETVGKEFSVVDGGWATLASVTWSWKYAFLMFPIQIVVNFIMLFFKKTNTLNIDMWNVWGKAFIAYLTVAATGSFIFGLIASVLMMALELILGDALQPQVQKMTGIEGVTCPHRQLLLCSLLYPIDLLLRKIPFLNRDFSLNTLRKKMGILFERHILGFILGTIFGLIAKYTIMDALKLGISAATALYLLPMVTKLFMQALNPIAEAATSRMKNVVKDRPLFIGLDSPMLLGEDAIWIVVMMCMPVTLFLSVVLPWNQILPFAALDNLTLGLCVYMVANGNILRMFILFIIGTPLYLSVATTLAPLISQLGVQNGLIEQGTLMASAGMDCPVFVYAFSQFFTFLQGHYLPLIIAVIYLIGYVVTVRGFKKEGLALQAASKK